VITDFGADIPFGRVPQKLQEHYGIRVPVSSAQAITQHHAQQVLTAEQEYLDLEIPSEPGVACLIVEIDGSMIPTVTTEASQDEAPPIDRRKTRKIGWQEARLGLSRRPEDTKPIFAATFGNPDEAGAQLLGSAVRAGLGEKTYVHGVGDGALWIAAQIDQHFGSPGRYLIDFYHLCEYLSAASSVCAPDDAAAWLSQQKKRLKRNHYQAVLQALEPFLEADACQGKNAPVRAAYRYLDNRPHQLDYKGAIDSDLPIGSGEIESAHRYVIQQRLKRSGSWWTVEKAWDMLALRVLRENQDWHAYWENLSLDVA
jgi:hypothetical protein